MNAIQNDLVAWYGEMVDAFERMSPEDRAELDAWDRAREPHVGTSEWPRWPEFIRPKPGGAETCEPHEVTRHTFPEGFYLYRLWSAGAVLIYVGVTIRPEARMRTHHRRWGDVIAWVTWERHPDAASMIAAEGQAIANEYPALNQAGV